MNTENMIIGSIFEISLRVLYLLHQFENFELSINDIKDLEFISVYSSYFEIDDSNLHGTGKFIKSEYYARYENVKNALKFLKGKTLIASKIIKNGEIYYITEDGKKVCNNIQNLYKENYIEKLNKIRSLCKDKKLKNIKKIIKNKVVGEGI